MSDDKFDAEKWVGSPVLRRTTSIEKLINNTDEKIKQTEKDLALFRSVNDKLKSAWFTEGDIVLTKNDGCGIICGIGFGDTNESTLPMDETLVNKLYVTLACKHGYKRYLFEDIMPYNTTTKVLYNK